MTLFEQVDINKDGKLTLDEFMKVAEPPFSADVPDGPTLEERHDRARSEFQTLDTNRNGLVETRRGRGGRPSEFNQYDTDRDNKIANPTEHSADRAALDGARGRPRRRPAEARRRQDMLAINDFIVHRAGSEPTSSTRTMTAGYVSRNSSSRPARPKRPQAQGLPPYDVRRQLAMRKFQEIDTNKDGQLDRVELTSYAVKKFLEMDINKDQFLTKDEVKMAQESRPRRRAS